MAGKPPKVQIGACFHGGKHLLQRADRTGQGIIHQDQFLISGNRFPSQCQQSLAVRAHIQPYIFPLNIPDLFAIQPITVPLPQRTVRNQHYIRTGHKGLYRKTAGPVQQALRVVMEIDYQPSHTVNPRTGRAAGQKSHVWC